MTSSHFRLSITLLIALIGHALLLYPTPELMPIPLKDITYSVHVELNTDNADSNSQETSDQQSKNRVDAQASKESKAAQEKPTEQPKHNEAIQLGSAQSKVQEETKQTKVSLPDRHQETLTTDDQTNHHFNTQTFQQTDTPPKRVAGIEHSETETTSKVEPQEVAIESTELMTTKESEASEATKANSQKTVKTEDAQIQPELTATEQYHAQIYAWILNGPNASILSTTKSVEIPPTIQFTWWRNGTIIFATVKTSSGDPNIDRIAKRAVLSASPLPKIPDHIQGKEYTLDITFAYFD